MQLERREKAGRKEHEQHRILQEKWLNRDNEETADWHELPDGSRHPSQTLIAGLPYHENVEEGSGRRHLKTYDYMVDVSNAGNYQYYGNLWVGSHMQ